MAQIQSKEDAFGTFTEGHIPFAYNGETFQTYYKLYGTLEGRTRDPLVILHGGPGLIHRYLLPYADLYKTHNIPVILYDQIGNGQSTHLKEKPPTFWILDLFMDELDNLLEHFKIRDSFNLLGHSWGGVMGSEYAVTRQPPGLKHIILANSLASIALWIQSTMQLLQAFPPEVLEGIKVGMKDPAVYYEALKIFHAKHGCIVKPTPREVVETFEAVFGPEGDTTVSASPLLSGWSVIDRLHNVKASALVVNGIWDIGQDFVCAPFFYKIPKAKWVRFDDCSHMPHWENRERCMKIVGDFLTADLE
ncbi:hypothetical protein Clacol_004889 [Clathrus columnatus]|uniref:AB hydrolase-1 domain-containing protein n=1 Tax=Clathrus columnatus TaxID=1419009 RepID=A0AAV5AAQ1_9AGAM|nr:hypothetical protein Clacol_004889 [Clathrus columnatus]